MRIFLDSNVLFSGLYSGAGAPGLIVDRIAAGDLTLVVSREVLDEVVRVLREKLPDSIGLFRTLLMSARIEIVASPKDDDVTRWSEFLDIGDAAVLASAIAAKPDYLVTGDRHFFSPQIAMRSGLRIVTPAQLSRIIA